MLVNEKFWQSLPADHQAVIRQAALEAEQAVREDMARIEAEAYEAAKAEGMSVVELTDAEIAEWREATRPVLESYLAESGELGRRVYEAAESLR